MGALKIQPCAVEVSLCLYPNPSAAGTFARWREFGRHMGLSQYVVAATACTSQGYISKLEMGSVTPMRSRWADLMRGYRITSEVDWLKLLNAARAQRLLRTPVPEREPLFAGSVTR